MLGLSRFGRLDKPRPAKALRRKSDGRQQRSCYKDAQTLLLHDSSTVHANFGLLLFISDEEKWRASWQDFQSCGRTKLATNFVNQHQSFRRFLSCIRG
jgi:hypothetical protein